MKKQSIPVSEATSSRILSISKRIIRPVTKHSPGIGTVLNVTLTSINQCKGGCKYCFCALSRKNKTSEPTIRRVTKDGFPIVCKVINVLKPNAITMGERVELGLYPKAFDRVCELRQNINSDILQIVTTKFPNKIWPRLNTIVKNNNIALLTTLSNPSGHRGLEPKVRTFDQRIDDVINIANSTKNLRLGVRLLVMQESDIKPLLKAYKKLEPYLDESLCWISFLRSTFMTKTARFKRIMREYINLDQYGNIAHYGFSLKEEVVLETIVQFANTPVTYDRLPKELRIEYKSLGIKLTDNKDEIMCYIRKDNVKCIKGACKANNTTCSGVWKPGSTKKSCINGICRNLADMTPAQFKATKRLWKWIIETKAFAYGSRKDKVMAKYARDVLATLRLKKLHKLIYG